MRRSNRERLSFSESATVPHYLQTSHSSRTPGKTAIASTAQEPSVATLTPTHRLSLVSSSLSSSPPPPPPKDYANKNPTTTAAQFGPRWRLTHRLLSLDASTPSSPALPLGSLPTRKAASRPRPSRLWNPVNSSPRPTLPTHALSSLKHPRSVDYWSRPVSVPDSTGANDANDHYPPLLLPQPQPRTKRHSEQDGSFTAEPPSSAAALAAAASSGRNSIGLPASADRSSISQAVDMSVNSTAAGAARELEAGLAGRLVSPELGRSPSVRSGAGSARASSAESASANDELAWGPSHPCFPHRNPHVPLLSPEYSSTRIIRIRRDWMVAGDLAPAFADIYPEVLDPAMTQDSFRRVLRKINGELLAAFTPWSTRAIVDAAMGLLTLWVWDDLGLPASKGRLDALERWIEQWNRETGSPEGVSIIPLKRTAYLSLDIQIPDPHIIVDSTTTAISRPTANADGPQVHGEYIPRPVVPTSDHLKSRHDNHLPLPGGVTPVAT